MAALTSNAIRTRSPSGLVVRQSRPSVTYYQGSLVGRRKGSSLCEVPLSASPRADLIIEGVITQLQGQPFVSSSTTDSGGGAIDAVTLQPQDMSIANAPCGWFDTGTSTHQITASHIGLRCYAFDSNTLYIDDLNGQLPFAGLVDDVNAAGKVFLRFDAKAATEDAGAAGEVDTARAVCTSLGANTGTTTGTLTVTATGALGAQDGLTLAPGDVLFIPEGTTNLAAASDAGPYEVINAGGTGVNAVLRRPSWYNTGDGIGLSRKIKVGGGGAQYAGTTWRSDALKGCVVDTDAPLFWPEKVIYNFTASSGSSGSITGVFAIKSLTRSAILITSTPTVAPHASTRDWRASAVTAGALNTAAVTVVAESAPGTTNTSDVGTYTVTVFN